METDSSRPASPPGGGIGTEGSAGYDKPLLRYAEEDEGGGHADDDDICEDDGIPSDSSSISYSSALQDHHLTTEAQTPAEGAEPQGSMLPADVETSHDQDPGEPVAASGGGQDVSDDGPDDGRLSRDGPDASSLASSESSGGPDGGDDTPPSVIPTPAQPQPGSRAHPSVELNGNGNGTSSDGRCRGSGNDADEEENGNATGMEMRKVREDGGGAEEGPRPSAPTPADDGARSGNADASMAEVGSTWDRGCPGKEGRDHLAQPPQEIPNISVRPPTSEEPGGTRMHASKQAYQGTSTPPKPQSATTGNIRVPGTDRGPPPTYADTLAQGIKSRPKVAAAAAEGATGASADGATFTASYRPRLPTYAEVMGLDISHVEDFAPEPPPYRDTAVVSRTATESVEQAGAQAQLQAKPQSMPQAAPRAKPDADYGGGDSWAEKVSKVASDSVQAVRRYVSPEQRERELIQLDPEAFVHWVSNISCSNAGEGKIKIDELSALFALHPATRLETATALLNNPHLGKVETEVLINVLQLILTTHAHEISPLAATAEENHSSSSFATSTSLGGGRAPFRTVNATTKGKSSKSSSYGIGQGDESWQDSSYITPRRSRDSVASAPGLKTSSCLIGSEEDALTRSKRRPDRRATTAVRKSNRDFRGSSEASAEGSEAIVMKEQALSAAACRWIQRRWGHRRYYGTGSSGKGRGRLTKNGQDPGFPVVFLGELCAAISALVCLPILSEEWSSTDILNAAQDTCSFRANDPVELLARLCEVMGERGASTDDAAAEIKGKETSGVFGNFSSGVISLLSRRLEEVVREYILPKTSNPGPSGEPAKKALETIRTYLDLAKHPIALVLVRQITESMAGTSAEQLFDGPGKTGIVDPAVVELDLERVLNKWEFWTFLLDWIGSATSEFANSGLDMLAAAINVKVRTAYDSITNGSFLPAQVQQFNRQTDSLAKLYASSARQCNSHTEVLEERAWYEVADSIRHTLSTWDAAVRRFGVQLDGAEALATIHCPAIGADGTRLGSNVMALRDKFENNLIPVRELSQASVLAGVVASSKEHLDEVPLEQLNAFSRSALFTNVWVNAGRSVFHKLHGEPSEETVTGLAGPEDNGRVGHTANVPWFHNEELEYDATEKGDLFYSLLDTAKDDVEGIGELSSTLPVLGDATEFVDEGSVDGTSTAQGDDSVTSAKLDLAAVVTLVIPLAFTRWNGLVADVLSGEMPARQASAMFRGPAEHIEQQIKLLFTWRVSALDSNDYGIWTDAHNTAGSVRASLEAYDCITWASKFIPRLLNVHVLLHSASTGSANVEITADASWFDSVAVALPEMSSEESEADGSKDEANSVPSSIFAVLPTADASRTSLAQIREDLEMRQRGLKMNQAFAVWEVVDDWESTIGSRINQQHRGMGADDTSSAWRRNGVVEKAGTLGSCRIHVELLSALLESPALVDWLIEHPSNEEFNQLLHVCRSLTDEPGLLSSIASLVEIRGRLMTVLFPKEPFNSLGHLLRTFSAVDLEHGSTVRASKPGGNEEGRPEEAATMAGSGGKEESLVWHVSNIAARFGSLVELFEKQTMSAGIQALRDLGDILNRGTFIVQTEPQNSTTHASGFSLALELAAVDVNALGGTTPERKLDQEYLLGLRARMAIMEVPEEEEKRWGDARGHGARVVVDAFKHQLQAMIDILEGANGLRNGGHLEYQQGWEMRQRFDLGGLTTLVETVSTLSAEGKAWTKQVDAARTRWPCLNYLTVQDIIHLNRFRVEAEDLPVNVPFDGASNFTVPSEAVSAVQCILRLLLTRPRREMAARLITLWVENSKSSESPGNWPDGDKANACPENNILGSLGEALAKALKEEAALGMGPATRSVPQPPLGTLNRSDGLIATVGGSGGPGSSVEENERRESVGTALGTMQVRNSAHQCLFASCTAGQDEAIRVVLSIYVRRGRLPEPGEVLFCTSSTTDEELALAVRRFSSRRKISQDLSSSAASAAANQGIFVIANVHRLGYSSQAVLLGHLRSKVLELDDSCGGEVGVDSRTGGAVLLIVSGEKRQAILSWLSDHVVELPPLPIETLRKAVAFGLEKHYAGTTMAVKSETNGGGKTHFIMKTVAGSLPDGSFSPRYLRVPMGESFVPRRLCRAMDSWEIPPGGEGVTFHLDVGHVPPPDCNTFLFQLLVEGCVRDPDSREIFVRWPAERFFLEIPNSENDRTAHSLHVCDLLPTTLLEMGPPQLDLELPVLIGTRVIVVPDEDTQRVCRWLSAIEGGHLLPGSEAPDPANDATEGPGSEECFALLLRCCCVAGGPSERPTWALFRTFARLLAHQLEKVERYPLLGAEVAALLAADRDGMATFRQVFVKLLVECSKDFALRSVPQINLIRPDSTGEVAPGAGDERGASGLPVGTTAAPESRRLAARYQAMIGWEQSDHDVVVFRQQSGDISGIDILSLNRHERRADEHIQGELRDALKRNFINFDRDWTSLTKQEGAKLVRDIAGVTGQLDEGHKAMGTGYVFTVDNLLKMLSITLRLKARMPVVIMGETGCGKSSLVSYMCAVLGWSLEVLNVHSGLAYDDIVGWVEDHAWPCSSRGDRVSVILLDEINACKSVGLFKEIVCDGTLAGKPLPSNLRIIAACNPYRLRKLGGGNVGSGGTQSGESTGREIGLASGILDEIQDLVYRVHPLHESLVDHVMDYGSLAQDTERLYISAMLNDRLQHISGDGADSERIVPDADMVDAFARCLCTAQESTREICGGERATVSLRDVSRCIKVFSWLGNMWVEHGRNSLVGRVHTPGGRSLSGFLRCKRREEREVVKEAMVLALAYSYQARLARNDRRKLVSDLCRATSIREVPHWLWLETSWFQDTVRNVMDRTAKSMDLGIGVAANEALRENIFVLLVSVLNSIPVFVVGKPGSSKSLAVSVLLANLRGRASASAFLRSFPAVEAFFHQCSPQSTSQGILQTWNTAKKYRQSAPNTVVIAYLDEIGLAELSPHLPLKVLHKILDEAETGETVVGISNWALDPAKMNRAVHLHRPPPTVDDLALTARSILQWGDGVGNNSRRHGRSMDLLLQGLAKAYELVYRNQRLPDFWGLREFYALVKAIDQSKQEDKALFTHSQREGVQLWEMDSAGSRGRAARSTATSAILSSSILARAVLRNFGGRRPAETADVLKVFFSVLMNSLPPPASKLPVVHDLIRENLAESKARHLMLLTKNNAALSLLFDLKLLNHLDTEVLFGSDFPGDRTDLQVTVDIQTVKACMARGGTVVLVHCDRLYESLYDLLNQHYTECAGKLFVRLAVGAQSQLCPLDPKFRVVVVVETADAYEKLDAPLLNRFEKQILGWQQAVHLCQEQLLFERLLDRLKALAHSLATGGDSNRGGTLADRRRVFPGYGTAFLPSLVFTVSQLARDGAAIGFDHQHKVSDTPAPTTPGEMKPVGYAKGHGRGHRGFVRSEHVLDEDLLYEECSKRLLAVATPEGMCRLTGHGEARMGDDGYLERDLKHASEGFWREAYGSLEDFSSRALKSVSRGHGQNNAASMGASTVIMTFAPLEGDAAVREFRGSPGGSWKVRHVMIHEVSQERELRARVKAFFSDDVEEDVLLLQCDMQASHVRMVEHVKFVVENERAAVVMDVKEPAGDSSKICRARDVHVVLLLHLIRGDDSFQMTFDTRWTCAFVDSVGDGGFGTREQGGLPTAVDAAGKSVFDIVSGLKNPSEILLLTLRASLAHLEFNPHRCRDIDEVRGQMEILLEACSGHKNPAFVAVAWDAVNHRLALQEHDGGSAFHEEKVEHNGDHSRGWEESKGDSGPEVEEKQEFSVRHGARRLIEDVTHSASSNQQLRLAGTFRRAIRASVLGAVAREFAAVLAHMDRNSGISLLKDNSMRDTWISLFQASYKGMGDQIVALPTRQSSGPQRKDRFMVHDSSAGPGGEHWRSRFPYSFYIFQLLQGRKADDRNGAATVALSEGDLQREFTLLRLGDHVHGNRVRSPKLSGGSSGDTYIELYTHDVMCMLLPSVRGVSRHDQGLYLLAMLDIAGPGPGNEQNPPVDWTPVRSLAAVHHRFWREEHAVRLHFKLLDAAGPHAFKLAFGIVKSHLDQVQQGWRLGELDPHLHISVLHVAQLALHESTELEEIPTVPTQGSVSVKAAAWASRVDIADRVTESMLLGLVVSRGRHNEDFGVEGDGQEDVLGELRDAWARLRLIKKLALNVVFPLPLPPQAALAVLTTFRAEPGTVRSKGFLVAIVRELAAIAANPQLCANMSSSRHEDALWGAIPRFLEEYLADTFTDEALAGDIVEAPGREHELRDVCEAFVAALSGNVAYFVGPTDGSLAEYTAQVSDIYARVWPREAACVEGLRRLRSSSSATERGRAITACLRSGLLRERRRSGGSCDNALAVSFCVAVEEYTTFDQAVAFIGDSRSRARQWGDDDEGATVERALTAVGYLRYLACAAAERLCTGEEEGGPLDFLFGALKDNSGRPSSIANLVGGVRNPGMFLLRQIVSHEGGGEDFLRRQLSRSPLNAFPWSLVDSRISDFAAGDKLPQVNPLMSIPFFEPCRALVSLFMDAGNTAQLEDGMFELVGGVTAGREHRSGGLAALKGGLLAGVFHEANLVQALGRQHDLSETCPRLEQWLLDETMSPSLSFLEATERRIVAAFVGHSRDRGGLGWRIATFFFSAGNEQSAGVQNSLCLQPDSTLDEIQRARLAAHVAAAFVSAGPTSPMAFFSVVATAPELLREVYVPAMDTTLTLEQIAVAGGKPHQCECGYVYVITECTKPMQRWACPRKGCERVLGGERHSLVQENTDRVNLPEARGYCLNYAEADEVPTVALRGMSAEQVASTRLLMHLAGIVGAVASAGDWADKARVMLNPDCVEAQQREPGGNLEEAFLRGAQADIAAIRRLTNRNIEQIVLGLHLALCGQQKPADASAEERNANASRLPLLEQLGGEAGRSQWEKEFCTHHLSVLSPSSGSVEQKLATAADELRRGGVGAAFATELLGGEGEDAEGGLQGNDVGRSLNTPGARLRLWGARRTFSLGSFVDTFLALGHKTDGQRPLLATLTDKDTLSVRLALPHLPAALQWINVLKGHFEGKLDREQARDTTAGEVLSRANAENRDVWHAAHNGFCEAWRYGRGLVGWWECTPIPSHYALASVNCRTPLSVFLPSLQDEGIFPLALLTHLAEQHNNIVRRSREVDISFGHGAEEVEPRHTTEAHAIVLNLESSASLLRTSQCDGKFAVEGAYDFDKAEFHLAQAAVAGVPIIRLEKEDITFRYAEEAVGGDTLLGKLDEKISRKPLPRGDREAILREISTPALAQSLLDTIEPAIGILTSVGGNMVQTLPPETAEMKLVDFLRDVLRMEGRSGGGYGGSIQGEGGDGSKLPPSVARLVRLQHLSDLWELATSATERDWTSGVSQRFREELPPDLRNVLTRAGDAMLAELDVLLPPFKNYIRTYLLEDSTTSSSITIKESLDWLQAGDDFLRDLEWFNKNWPAAIQMRYAVSAFELLDSRRSI